MIVTCIKPCTIEDGFGKKSMYFKGDKIDIDERQYLNEHWVYRGGMYPKSIFLTKENLREFNLDKLCE